MKEISNSPRSKYSQSVTEIRKLAKNTIIEILKNKPLQSGEILARIEKKFPNQCNPEILCVCKGNKQERPEWQHQVLWAIQDLKYSKIINFDSNNKTYSLLSTTK